MSVPHLRHDRPAVVEVHQRQHFRGRLEEDDRFDAVVLLIGDNGKIEILGVHRGDGLVAGAEGEAVGGLTVAVTVGGDHFGGGNPEVELFLAGAVVVDLRNVEIAAGDAVVVFDSEEAVVGDADDNQQKEGAERDKPDHRAPAHQKEQKQKQKQGAEDVEGDGDGSHPPVRAFVFFDDGILRVMCRFVHRRWDAPFRSANLVFMIIS